MAEPLLPTFVIGGAPRSGTTYLAHALDSHPQVTMAKPYVPEPKVLMTAAPDAAAYRARYEPFFEDADRERARGEKTSYYLEFEPAARLFDEVLPEAKILFLIREPVGRAYSNWLWSRQNGLEDLPFAQAVAVEGKRPSPLPPERAYARPFDYLTRNDYHGFARRWLDALGPERVRFWLYEDLTGDRGAEQLTQIQEFIGVEPRELAVPDELVVGARHSGPPLDAALERELRERMRPGVQAFGRLCNGLDLSAWKY